MDNRVKGTIEEMQKLAEAKRGQCLSKKYTSNHIRLKWCCEKGHIWEATPASIKRGHWCPRCAHVAKGTIEEMQKLAEAKRGQCLSKKYINNRKSI